MLLYIMMLYINMHRFVKHGVEKSMIFFLSSYFFRCWYYNGWSCKNTWSALLNTYRVYIKCFYFVLQCLTKHTWLALMICILMLVMLLYIYMTCILLWFSIFRNFRFFDFSKFQIYFSPRYFARNLFSNFLNG